jgi:hypothetical protein
MNEVVVKLNVREYEFKKYFDWKSFVVPELDRQISCGFFLAVFSYKIVCATKISVCSF